MNNTIKNFNFKDYIHIIENNLKYFKYSELGANDETLNINLHTDTYQIYRKKKIFPLRYKSYFIVNQNHNCSMELYLADLESIDKYMKGMRTGYLAFTNINDEYIKSLIDIFKYRNLLRHTGAGHVGIFLNLETFKTYMFTESRLIKDPFQFGYFAAQEYYKLLLIKRVPA